MRILRAGCCILRLNTMDTPLPHSFALVYVCLNERLSEKQAD